MPSRMPSFRKENGFFGDIAIPNQHVLRKSDVGPKDIQSKKKFSEIMKMIFIDHISEIPLVLKYEKNNDRHRESCYNRACKIVYAVNCTKPVCFKRHDPIDRSKGERDCK